ncbi:MAG: hypothetical protein AMXMBFR7_28630 [Planctomycetota bacterium]
MAVDYIINLPCEPKLAFGTGDLLQGTGAILELLKARNRAAAIVEIAKAKGKSPSEISVTVRVLTPDGIEQQQSVTHGTLVEQCQPLAAHAAACRNCPGNSLQTEYGCYGALNYPVPASAERWLFAKLQPPSHVGGNLFLQSVKQFDNRGTEVERMRAAGLFESKLPFTTTHRISFFNRPTFTSSQLIEAILGVGESLDTWHCGGILLWLGAIQIDGVVPVEPRHVNDFLSLQTVADRQSRTSFCVEEPLDHTGESAFYHVLKALYTAWVLGVPILVSP